MNENTKPGNCIEVDRIAIQRAFSLLNKALPTAAEAFKNFNTAAKRMKVAQPSAKDWIPVIGNGKGITLGRFNNKKIPYTAIRSSFKKPIGDDNEY